MGKSINPAELKQLCRTKGKTQAAQFVINLVESKEILPDDMSIRELAEAFLGEDRVRAMENRKSGGFRYVDIQEAVTAVDSSAFSNITGQLVFNKIKDAFELNSLVSDQLVTVMKSAFLDDEIVPGIGGIGDLSELVGAGEEYPVVGLNEEYVRFPAGEKRGAIVPITREAIVADRTGVLMQRAGDIAKWMALNKEKRILDCVLGVTNTYNRNGTSSNTYLTAGAYINDKTSNSMVDWSDIENLDLLFDAIVDPNTNEPIDVVPDTLIVPTALKATAHRIVSAMQIRFGDGASSTTAAYSPNPVGNGLKAAKNLNIISSPYVKSRTTSATKWFYGQPKKAFVYKENWATEVMQAPAGNSDDFHRDIVAKFKVTERGTPAVLEPRYMCRSDQ